MASLQIRDVPIEILEALRLRARRENRSLAQQALVELRTLPELESRNRRRSVLETICNETQAGVALSVTPEEVVREDRDR